MDSDLETVELDRVPLPPIPGPLPPTFFTDIPPGSAAIFSTLLGTSPFRPLPNPVPIHAIRSGSEDDIRISHMIFSKDILPLRSRSSHRRQLGKISITTLMLRIFGRKAQAFCFTL